MRLDAWFIGLALIFLFVGEGVGEFMARSRDHSFALVHSHITVIGWVSLALFGLIHRSYPALAESGLALPQFLIAVGSTIAFIGGMELIWAAGNPAGAIVGSFGLMIATLLFGVMFFQHVILRK